MDKEVDMVFKIFDTNKDGVLDSDSLKFLYKNRERLPVVAEKQQMLSLLWTLVLGSTAVKAAAILVYPLDWVSFFSI